MTRSPGWPASTSRSSSWPAPRRIRASSIGTGSARLPTAWARIRRGGGHDELRLVLAGQPGDLVIVDQLGLQVYAVMGEVEELAGETDRAAVGQMAALTQLHAQDGVARLEQREVDRHVGRAA